MNKQGGQNKQEISGPPKEMEAKGFSSQEELVLDELLADHSSLFSSQLLQFNQLTTQIETEQPGRLQIQVKSSIPEESEQVSQLSCKQQSQHSEGSISVSGLEDALDDIVAPAQNQQKVSSDQLQLVSDESLDQEIVNALSEDIIEEAQHFIAAGAIKQVKRTLPTEGEDQSQEKKIVTKSRYSEQYQQPALHYIAHKAGMDTIDKERINQMILEASKDSDYYKRELQRTEDAKNRAKILRVKIDQYQKNEKLWKRTLCEVKTLLAQCEKERCLERTWMHIDMDMFYAAVEIRDNPELAKVPLAVGSDSMCSTANYLARKFGVRSAMPGFIAKKLCPDLIIVPCNYQKYKAVSKVFKQILEEYDPEYESMGLDEVNIDATNYLIEKGVNNDEGREALALEIRTRINEATNLTCSAGIANNKMLAKICSDINKPNGQSYLKPDREEIAEFMRQLPVRKIPGCGRMLELTLSSLDIYRCSDIIDKAPEILVSFRERTYAWLFTAALGISRYFHEEDDEDACQKSISISSTFRPVYKYDQFKEKFGELCEDLANRMDKRKLAGLTLTAEFKNTKFNVMQKSMTLHSYIWTYEDLMKYSLQILDANWPCDPCRLIGVKVSSLKNLHEVKRDKSLTQFFKDKVSKEDYLKQHQHQLAQLHQPKLVESDIQTLPNKPNKKTQAVKVKPSSNAIQNTTNTTDIAKQKRISSFVISSSQAKAQISTTPPATKAINFFGEENKSTESDIETIKKPVKSVTAANTKKRKQPVASSPSKSSNPRRSQDKRKKKDSNLSSRSIQSFFSAK